MGMVLGLPHVRGEFDKLARIKASRTHEGGGVGSEPRLGSAFAQRPVGTVVTWRSAGPAGARVSPSSGGRGWGGVSGEEEGIGFSSPPGGAAH